MSHPRPHAWSELTSSPISEEAIRLHHQPAEQYKLYVNTYVGGERVSIKASHAFTLYVVQGSCSLQLVETSLPMIEGQWLALEAQVLDCVVGAEGVRIVKVFSR
ncbi:MAG: hypothetical protein K2P84_05085 [Undibacterium sp.]|nr:hypothetical protein [Undibacterium sp.]